MAEITVRRAAPDDAADVARVHLEAWREAYTGRIPTEIIEGRPMPERIEGWRRAIAGETRIHQSEIFVAESSGAVIGFASAGESRDPERPAPRELYAIYVLAAHYGSGAGRALLDAALGDAAASLWVLADNPRARAFYAKRGFVADGATKDDERFGGVHEVRLVRPALD